MSKAIEQLTQAQQHAMNIRPTVGGFPYLAEALRKFGITKNIWNLPSCQSIYLTTEGPVVTKGFYLVETTSDVPKFDEGALIKAIRTDQAGQSTFPEFLQATWKAGIVRYIVDFEKRVVTYYGVYDEAYSEHYPAVEIG